MTIDLTMTATFRPDVIQRTISSFKEKMFRGYPIRFIINVDPVGDTEKREEMVEIIHRSFARGVVNWASTAHFPKAFKWVWSHVESPFLFHLEDDWELLRDIDIYWMLNMMAGTPELAILRLPAFKAGQRDMKNWNKFFPWNGSFFECPEKDRHRVGFCGHPSLIRKEWYDKVFPLINDEKNPEKQFQYAKEGNRKLYEEIIKWRYGVWAVPGDPPAVRDIGRDWISKTDWRKQGSKAFFIRWERGSSCSGSAS